MKLSRVFAGITVLILIFAVAGTATAQLTFQAGLIDDFTLPADPAEPSAELAAALPAIQDFDLVANVNGGTPDTQVAHTFSGLPPGIVGASLALRVQAGDDFGTTSDGIILSFVEMFGSNFADDVVYARAFGHFDGPAGIIPVDPGLVQTTPWTVGDDATFTLDLSALPLVGGGAVDLIPALNSRGFLDVTVSDETGADYMIELRDFTFGSWIFVLKSASRSLGLEVYRGQAGRWRGSCYELPIAQQDSALRHTGQVGAGSGALGPGG